MPTAITRAEAIAVVEDQAATDVEPTLTEPEVGKLVDRSARADADGETVGSDDWTPTYDLNAATALAWERKAALTATVKFDISVDRQQLTRSQIYDHCIDQAKRYRARTVGRLRRAEPENHQPFGSYDVVTKS